MTCCYTLSMFSPSAKSRVLNRPHIKNAQLPSFIRLRESHSKMSESIYGNINTDRTWVMDRCTKANHTPQHTGSDPVQIRSSRAAAVCLLLLCVVLLTAVIVLCVHLHTKNTNYREETHKLLSKINNLTEQSDLLLTKYINLTNERNGLFKQRDQFNQERNRLQKILNETDGWLHSNFSFYFISSLKKSWTESRKYCTERGADLIIINNREKQDFVTKMTDKREFWIGVTDIKEEGRWKWVDGTSVTSGFWASSGQITEPNGGRQENCAVTYLKKHPELIGWIDITCNGAYQWICEKSGWP
ncbi:C-type lectin domain family 4 member F-like [Sinocyclocheilus grahami]|uniref:C-type lectin domain family 4 member F-like n=1 Tax=Sinocyclocheilus grahami TaxID=75366 RepID=UPI0007ACB6B4|nr:PREDICTED: C-type lectin domain family 4 member F-like [Sinocyclocheilus grahami]